MKKIITLSCVFLAALMSCKKNGNAPVIQIINFTPGEGAAGTIVKITGHGFDSIPANITVSFSGAPATPYQSSDSVILVKVPKGATTGKIAVSQHGRSTTSVGDFIILPGTWAQKANLPADARSNNIAFSINGKGYTGFGQNGGVEVSDFWEYSPVSDQWSKKSDPGVRMELPICMIINNKAYVGDGVAPDKPFYTRQFFEYDPATGNWTKKSDFPGDFRIGAVGFSVNGKGYAGLGTSWYVASGDTAKNGWFAYDPATDVWTKKNDPPADFYYPAGFTVNGKIFVGYKNSLTQKNLWYQYDYTNDTWIQKNDFPGLELFGSTGVVINGKGYIMGGSGECWQYDDATDTWAQKAFLGARGFGAAFSINDKGYFVGGFSAAEGDHNDLWEFIPQ